MKKFLKYNALSILLFVWLISTAGYVPYVAEYMSAVLSNQDATVSWNGSTFAASTTAGTPTNISGAVTYDNAITEVISLDQDDYTPTGVETSAIMVLTTGGNNITMSGIKAPTGGGIQSIKLVNANTDGKRIDLLDADAGSIAANRFNLGATITVAAGSAVELLYINSAWIAL